MSLPAWEKLPPVKPGYARLVDLENGRHDDVLFCWLEGAMEASDRPLQILKSQKQWLQFLEWQRGLATEWNLRNTFTERDRAFLAELKILWEPETFRHARWRESHTHVHDDDFLRDFAPSFQELDPEQQKQLRKEICERTTGKPYRPD